MSGKTVETILTGWRKLERDLAPADGDAREEIQARIAELRDQYQALFAVASRTGRSGWVRAALPQTRVPQVAAKGQDA